MKNKINAEKISPRNYNILVKVMKLPNNENGIYKSQHKEEDFKSPPNYLGKVISFGEKVEEIEKGDFVLFPKIAYDSNHILTEGKELYKMINIMNVVVKSKSTGMKVETLKTVKNRIIVDVTETIKKEEGLSNTGMEGDKRNRDLLKGTIVAISDDAKEQGYDLGDTVYFSLEMGVNVIEIKGKGKYRSIQWTDISFVYKE